MACQTCNTSNTCNNINCSCGNNTTSYGPRGELGGTYKIVDSHMVCNNKARAAFFKGGGCTIIPKGYIPSVKGQVVSNGPKLQGCRWGTNPAPESEGMDCLNYKFNQNRHG